jgi:hypothetical protein
VDRKDKFEDAKGLIKTGNSIYFKEETRECVCLRERGHNGHFDNCINRNKGSSFL